MNEIKPEIRKKNGEWEVDYDKDAPIIIRGQPTKKDPLVEVDMGLRLVPVKIRYKEEGKFTEEQVRGGVETLQKNGCKLCSSSEKTLAKFITMTLDNEGVQPLNPNKNPNNATDDIENKGLFGFRDRLFLRRDRESIIGGRNGILGNIRNRGSSVNASSQQKRKKRIISLQELRDIRPRILDMFILDY